MQNRITIEDLKRQCEILNRHFGYALEPYSTQIIETTGGEHQMSRPNPDVFHISQAYGGVSIHQMAKHGTGVRDVLSIGHLPKREVWNRMNAYIVAVKTDRD